MPSLKKVRGLFDENKTDISMFCGKITFIGSPKCVLLKQRLHTKKCNFCKLAISQGVKQCTKKDLDSLPKSGSVGVKVNPFSDYLKADEKVRLKNSINNTATIIINPEDIV